MCTECRHGPRSQSADIEVSSSDSFTARYWSYCITLLSGGQLSSARVTSDLVFLEEVCGEGPRGIAQHLINIAAVRQSVVAFVFCHHRVAFILVGEFITADWLKTSRQDGRKEYNSGGSPFGNMMFFWFSSTYFVLNPVCVYFKIFFIIFMQVHLPPTIRCVLGKTFLACIRARACPEWKRSKIPSA